MQVFSVKSLLGRAFLIVSMLLVIATPFFAQKQASAAPTYSSQGLAQQLEAWTFANMLYSCYRGGANIETDRVKVFDENKLFYSGALGAADKHWVGGVAYSQLISSYELEDRADGGYYSCDHENFTNSALAAMGITDTRQFVCQLGYTSTVSGKTCVATDQGRLGVNRNTILNNYWSVVTTLTGIPQNPSAAINYLWNRNFTIGYCTTGNPVDSSVFSGTSSNYQYQIKSVLDSGQQGTQNYVGGPMRTQQPDYQPRKDWQENPSNEDRVEYWPSPDTCANAETQTNKYFAAFYKEGVYEACRTQYTNQTQINACIDGADHTSPTDYCANTYKDTTSVVPGTGGQATVPVDNSKLRDACQFGQQATPSSTYGLGAISALQGDLDDGCPLQNVSMRWLGCSIYFLLHNAAEKLTQQIDTFLFTDPDSILNENTMKAAQVFRNFALILVVIAGLIMVISQALGLEILDAYTIRKMLPRLGFVIIGIALAWPLLKLIVELTNDLGGIVYSLLVQIPIDAGAAGTPSDFGTGVGATMLGIFGSAAFFIAYGPAALTFILAGALALFIGFLVLAVRQIIIFTAVIMAPIAIAAYAIPGGQKLWNFWKSALLTTLFMYPLIMGMLGAGVALSFLLGMNADGNVESLLAIAVYFAPFFMIPFAFKLAGGLMSTIFSIANDRNKGAFDRLKNYRGQKLEQRRKDFRAGSLGEGTAFHGMYNRLGVNSAGRRIQAGMRGRYGFGARGESALAVNAGIAGNQALKENAQLQQFAVTNDEGNAVLALSGGTAAGARAAAEQLFRKKDANGNDAGYDEEKGSRAIAAAASIGFSERNSTAALTGLAQNKSRAIGQGRTDIVRDGIQRLAGENAQLNDDLVGNFAYNSRGAGRADLGGMNWGLTGMKAGYDEDVGHYANQLAGGGTPTTDNIRQAEADMSMMDGVGRTKVHEIVGGHTNGVKQATDTMIRMIEHGNVEQKKQAATHLLEFQQNMSGASMDNQRIINQALSRVRVEYDSERSVADQLGGIVGLTGQDLSRGARTYGEDVPREAREAQNNPQA